LPGSISFQYLSFYGKKSEGYAGNSPRPFKESVQSAYWISIERFNLIQGSGGDYF